MPSFVLLNQNTTVSNRVFELNSVIARANTVKQGILYRTCTGPAVEVIGLVPTHD